MIVDRLTKSAHFLPFQMSDGVDKCVELYMRVIVKLHGSPISIVSDRDPQFALNFWMVFQKALGTKLHMSTTYHHKWKDDPIIGGFTGGLRSGLR